MNTPIDDVCSILSTLWISYRADPAFKDFIVYNDLALPLAYAIATELIETSPKAEIYIQETWTLLLAALGLEDTIFATLDEMLDGSSAL